MAEFVDENTPPLIQNKGGRKGIYKWDDWFKHNKSIRLTQGKDFDVSVQTFMPQIYNAASRRNGTVTVKKGEDILGNTILEVTFSFNAKYFRDLDRMHQEIERDVREPSEPAPEVPEDGLLDDSVVQPGQWGPPPTSKLPVFDPDNLPMIGDR
jgi:hypothetical protein